MKASTLRTMIDALAKLPLEFSPGTRWNYSVATDVLGYLVEVMSGMTFDAYLRTRIFEPLGMKDTAFTVARRRGADRFAANYSRGPGKALRLRRRSAEQRLPETANVLFGRRRIGVHRARLSAFLSHARERRRARRRAHPRTQNHRTHDLQPPAQRRRSDALGARQFFGNRQRGLRFRARVSRSTSARRAQRRSVRTGNTPGAAQRARFSGSIPSRNSS